MNEPQSTVEFMLICEGETRMMQTFIPGHIGFAGEIIMSYDPLTILKIESRPLVGYENE